MVERAGSQFRLVAILKGWNPDDNQLWKSSRIARRHARYANDFTGGGNQGTAEIFAEIRVA